jgi:segregation and condensation protein A
MDHDGYQVRVNEFEGPLDLLLSLIEKKKLCINDVSLAEITDSFLEHIRALPEYSFERTTDFISVAATLILIKSLSLLPSLSLTRDEQTSIQDLEDRLITYKRICELTVRVREIFCRRTMFPRGEIRFVREPVFAPTPSLNLAYMRESVFDAINKLPIKELRPEVRVKNTINLEDVITDLVGRVQRNFKMRFNDFVGGRTEKINVIVSFLAMLELVKRGSIIANQESHFEEIHMESQICDVPRYG